MKNGVRMCSSVQNFIKCHENSEESCSAKNYIDFVHILKKFACRALEMYK